MEKQYKTSEASRRSNAKWNAAHREEHLQMQRDWIKAHPDRRREAVRKCRLRKKIIREGFFEMVGMIDCF